MRAYVFLTLGDEVARLNRYLFRAIGYYSKLLEKVASVCYRIAEVLS